MRATYLYRTSPSPVRARDRVVRFSSRKPKRASSRSTALPTADADSPSLLPAVAKLPASTATENATRPLSDSIEKIADIVSGMMRPTDLFRQMHLAPILHRSLCTQPTA